MDAEPSTMVKAMAPDTPVGVQHLNGQLEPDSAACLAF